VKTVTLSNNVEQETPVAFIVIPFNTAEYGYRLFFTESAAQDYADDQAEISNTDSWPIYALWATEWPINESEERSERLG
jgi:hypothetical protein